MKDTSGKGDNKSKISDKSYNDSTQASPCFGVHNLVVDDSKDETATEYTDEQFYIDFPEKIKKCQHCSKKFTTQFDAKFCSDRCWCLKVLKRKDYFKRTYVRSGRRS